MNRESKEIFERQNLPGLIAAQKTASNCYSAGKLWSALLVFLSVVVPVVINIILSIFNIDILNGCLIFLSFICFGLSELIRVMINKWKFYGAGMQQYFDEFVFELKNSCRKYICPKKLSQFERSKLIKKFEKKVIYFGGCSGGIKGNRAVVKLLNSCNIEVITPNFKCCGISFYVRGDMDNFSQYKDSYLQIMKKYTNI